MIQDTFSSKRKPAITSDRWHIVHSHFTRDPGGRSRFERSITGEHDGRGPAVVAARALMATLVPDLAARPHEERDQVFVRRPDFKSLKVTRKRVERSA